MNEEVKCIWCDRSGASRVAVRRKDEEAAEEGRATHAGPLKLCQGVWTGSSGQWGAS